MRGTRQRGNAGSGTLECFFLNSEKTVCVPRLYGDMRATLKSVAQVFEWCRLSGSSGFRVCWVWGEPWGMMVGCEEDNRRCPAACTRV